MKSQRIRITWVSLLILCLALIPATASWSHAAFLSDEIGEQIKEQIEGIQLGEMTLDLNLQIPITGNPAGPDTHLWATAVYHNTPDKGTFSMERPVILIATAYRREMMLMGYLLSFLQKGYNVVAVDMRGTGSAEGIWGAMDPIEQFDLAYVIDGWLPDQPWCNGKVGMVGGSYMAILQYLVAGLLETEVNPKNGKTELKHLKALAPQSSMSDAYREIVMHGGNFEIEFMTVWIAATDLMSIMPPDLLFGWYSEPGINMEDLEYAAQIWNEHLHQLNVPIDHLSNPDNIVKNPWYEDKSPFIYWHEKPEGGWDFGPKYPAQVGSGVIPETLPVFNVTGWFDIFTRGTLNNYQYGLSKHANTDKALIIGPWYHVDAAMICPGVNGIGLGGEGLTNNDILLRWMDWKLKGESDPFMEEFPVVSYILGEERWRADKDWPLPDSRVSDKTYYLSKDKAPLIFGDWFSVMNNANNYKLVEQVTDRDYFNTYLWFKRDRDNPALNHNPPVFHGINSRSAQRWLGFSPLTMVSQISKYMLNIDMDAKLPWEDERLDEVGVLTFTTEPLAEDVEIAGPLTLTFWAKTTFDKPLCREKVDEALGSLKSFFDIGNNETLMAELADKKDVQWVIELNDVFPGGRARNITSGWLSAWHRPYDPDNPTRIDPEYTPFDPFYDNASKNPMPIEEDTVYPYVVELWPTDNVFKKGHRIRVSISASDVPHLFPVFRPSTSTLVTDADHPARLDFKVVNQAGEGKTWKWLDNVSDYLMTHKN